MLAAMDNNRAKITPQPTEQRVSVENASQVTEGVCIITSHTPNKLLRLLLA